MTVSIVLSTYNWPGALKLVLESIMLQSQLPNEIIIADDGSSFDTTTLIRHYISISSIPIHHIYHEDNGFRKSIILNKAIITAKSKYILQVDGDCILHKHFIKDHVQFIKPHTFVHGSRVFLSQNLTSKLIINKESRVLFSLCEMSNLFNALYLPMLSFLFDLSNKKMSGTRGCNFAFMKQDFININGYNEDIVGWGREDTELSLRLMNNNIQKRRLKLSGIMYHLHHPLSSKITLEKNIDILNNTIINNVTFCKNGCDKYI